MVIYRRQSYHHKFQKTWVFFTYFQTYLSTPVFSTVSAIASIPFRSRIMAVLLKIFSPLNHVCEALYSSSHPYRVVALF